MENETDALVLATAYFRERMRTVCSWFVEEELLST